MKATFIGDPSQPKGAEHVPDEFKAYGLVFERGKATTIPEHLEAKIAGNSHYRVSTKGEVAAPATTESVADMTKRISTVTDVEALQAELAKEERTTGKSALEARIAELTKPAE